MTAPLIGFFILAQFDADLGWWAAMLVAAGLDYYQNHEVHRQLSERMFQLGLRLDQLPSKFDPQFLNLSDRIDALRRSDQGDE